jgi:hypothetical protein
LFLPHLVNDRANNPMIFFTVFPLFLERSFKLTVLALELAD